MAGEVLNLGDLHSGGADGGAMIADEEGYESLLFVMVEDTIGLVWFGACAVLLGIATTTGALMRWRRASLGFPQVWVSDTATPSETD